MSREWISAQIRSTVRERAGGCCEYCRIPDFATLFPHEPDHVISEQHGGETCLENLALCCSQCNRVKGPNIASIDPDTNQIVPLFNPRNERWTEHFRFEAGRILPITPVGRATARLLNFSDEEREQVRFNLWRAGLLSV
jgi:hypothetical protein